MFPEEGSPKWKLLCQLFPEYFESEVEPKSFFESLTVNSFTAEEIDDIVHSSITPGVVCERLFEGRDQEYIWKCCIEPYKNTQGRRAADGEYMSGCNNCGVGSLFVKDSFSEKPLTIIESYEYYVIKKHNRAQG